MASIEGKKNSNEEMRVSEFINAYATQKKIPLQQVLLNKKRADLDEYLTLPKTFDVRGKAFEDFAKKRLEKFLPFINVMDYLESTVAHPNDFKFDIVVTYNRKDPVFFEINGAWHYLPVKGGYKGLAERIRSDYAKKVLIEAAGYKFVEIPNIGRSQNEVLSSVLKEI